MPRRPLRLVLALAAGCLAAVPSAAQRVAVTASATVVAPLDTRMPAAAPAARTDGGPALAPEPRPEASRMRVTLPDGTVCGAAVPPGGPVRLPCASGAAARPRAVVFVAS